MSILDMITHVQENQPYEQVLAFPFVNSGIVLELK